MTKNNFLGTGRPILAAALLLAIFSQFVHLLEVQSTSDRLWESTRIERESVLQSPFLLRMKNGLLDPTKFGAYMVQDSVYCFVVKDALYTASTKASGHLKEFLENKSYSYLVYYKSLFKSWHIKDVSGITLGTACQDYANHIARTAFEREPIYLLVASLPCERLWPWIGQQLFNTTEDTGCYKSWVEENFNPDSQGYRRTEEFVNNYENINMTLATEIYKKSMASEANFFNSVMETM